MGESSRSVPANVPAINARLDAAGYAGPRISTGSFDTSLDATNVFARGDINIAPENQLVARYSQYDVASSNARNAGGLNAVSRGTRLDDRDRTVAVGDTWSLSDTILSETRGQWTRSRLSAPPNDVSAPAVNISGIASFGVATSSPTARDIDLAEVAQTVMTVHGGHSLKAGVDWLQNKVLIAFPGAVQGVYSFSSLANFLAGNFSTFQQAFGPPETHQTNDNFSVFVQDEWRTGRRVTINAGARYDLQLLPSLVHTDRNNISPRLGMAWDPFGDGRSVVRASGGLYYDRIPLRAVSNALQRDGVTYRIVQVGAASPAAPLFPNTFVTMPATIPTNITTIDPNIENGYTIQGAVQYERQIGSTASASIGYEHMRGRNIIMSRNVNVPTTTDPTVPNLGRPDPRFGNNSQYQSIGESWYDGLTVAIDRRPASWGSVRLAYTFSKGLDTAGNFFFSQPQNANDIRAERGRSDNDQRHRLTLSGTFVTPVANLSAIFAYASALPFNIQVPFDRNGDTNFNDRPAGVGRNTGKGFGYHSLDLRLSRVFMAGRGLSLEGIVDAFNVFDRANYQVPNNIFGSPTFGRPTAAQDPRQLQLGVRVGF